MVEKFDLFVVGGGSGGIRAARYASSHGIKTGLAEGWTLGGTCVNRGCIPKKLYAYASHFADELQIMKSYGWSILESRFDWKKLTTNKKKEIKRLNYIYCNLLKKSKVRVYNNYAQFLDNKILKIGNKLIEAKKILISVGTKPKKLEQFKELNLISSDEAFDLKSLPKNILILGGGYIAVEFASIFNGLGVNTSLCIRGKRILKDFDSEISEFLMEQMSYKGIKIIREDFPKKIEFQNNEFNVYFNRKKSSYDRIMEATGRVPNLDKLNIHNANVKLNNNGAILIDKNFRTSQKHIFAIGDVVDRVQLTPVAIAEAMVFVKNLLSKDNHKLSYKNIPTAVFSNPNYACIGYNEKEAKKLFGKIKIYKSSFKALKLSITNSNEKVFIKLITHKSTDKILGLHYIGENAAEIVQGFSVAVVNGLTKKQLDKTIGIHPSSAEEIVTLK